MNFAKKNQNWCKILGFTGLSIFCVKRKIGFCGSLSVKISLRPYKHTNFIVLHKSQAIKLPKKLIKILCQCGRVKIRRIKNQKLWRKLHFWGQIAPTASISTKIFWCKLNLCNIVFSKKVKKWCAYVGGARKWVTKTQKSKNIPDSRARDRPRPHRVQLFFL